MITIELFERSAPDIQGRVLGHRGWVCFFPEITLPPFFVCAVLSCVSPASITAYHFCFSVHIGKMSQSTTKSTKVASKATKKSAISRPKDGEKKRKHKKVESFSIYIYRVLRQVNFYCNCSEKRCNIAFGME